VCVVYSVCDVCVVYIVWYVCVYVYSVLEMVAFAGYTESLKKRCGSARIPQDCVPGQ
jgi:hypothetical protein